MPVARCFILAALAAAPALGLAEPAVVRVFEAQARAAPDPSAPLVHVFIEGAKVSVSEEVTGGWRRVRLPDGGVAFIEDKALAFPGGPTATPPGSEKTAASVAPPPLVPEGFAWAVTRTVTKLRSIPDASGSLLHEVAARTTVLVSVEVVRGFRRVRVPDGRAGFAPDEDLEVSAVPPAVVPPPATTPSVPGSALPAAPSPRVPAPHIYVKDLDHFAELVRDDPKVGPMARTLQNRRTGAYVFGGAGLAAGIALIVNGVSHFEDTAGDMGRTSFAAGIGVGGLSVLVAWLIYPGRVDFLEAVNEWNTRHPDRQFDLTVSGSPRQVALPPAPAGGTVPGFTRVAGFALAF